MNQDYENEEYLEGEEIEIEAIGIEVDSQPIELYKLFKIANLVSGGGEAKHVIDEGYVAVNGELETRKRRKMYDGDFFEFNQEFYVVVCDAPVTEPEAKATGEKKTKSPQAQCPSAAQPANKAKKNKAKQDKGAKQSGKRKPAAENKPKPTRDPKSGRNSIDFF
ncbi:RNA-binding S4 domain-containing protein [Vibrio sp. CAU 1672]|uniref:RNA-binding S4 domain-containing protein n=1 Tax=Vibrio sp. CAU 1672 TaxID=3032594 RepID=UPI0023DA2D32|nr:RNA-binding S4 domain-containing protein [Vibrio sp. CAU 1672]MDF2154838.1 RNA-binding S4 domain-containing protein [Vibrio sp. CAU 1672]